MASLAGPQSESTAASDASAWKPRSALIGTLLANRYKVIGPVGQGSTGAVFRADDVLSGKPVAVRVLVPALAQLPNLIPRIRARIDRNNAISQRDPGALINLVDIFDVGMTLEGELFVVSDFLEGDHLATMLTRGGRLPWSRARSLLIRLCQIVHGLHQEGIVLGGLEARHCYAIRGKTKHEAIKVVNNAVYEQLASTIGPHAGHGATILARYIAPEQACGDAMDARSDIYSFGIIAYELLTGSVPFTDANPVRLVSMHLQRPPRPPRDAAPDANIPAEIEVALLRSLAKDPNDRFATMDAFAAALTAVPESAPPTGAHAIVPASLAASEIPSSPAGPREPATTPTTSTEPAATPTTPTKPAATTLAAPSTPEPAPPALVPPSNVPTPGRRIASIPTHVTLPPGSMTSDIIRGLALPTTLGSTSSRPATLPPTLGSLRLPPPPTLGRPATIPPSGLILPPPRAPSTTSASALPRLGSSVLIPSPQAPSAALPTDTLLRSSLAPLSETSAPVPADSLPAPSDSLPAPSDNLPAPSDSLPAPSDSKPAAVPADSLPAPSDSPTATPTADIPAFTPLAAAAANKPAEELRAAAIKPADEPRPGASTSGARRPIITLGEPRKDSDSAASSGTYVHTNLAEAATSQSTAPVQQATPQPQPEKPRLVHAPRPSEDRVRSAALQQSQAGTVPSTLSQVHGTDSLIAEVPRSRSGLWIVLGLAAAAGIAALVFTSPSFTTSGTGSGTGSGTALIAKAKAKATLADATSPKLVTDPPPDRGTGIVDPPTDPKTLTPDPTPTDPTPTDPPPIAVPEPSDETTSKPGKKDPKKKKTPRVKEEPEEPEKDVFDQVREHMAAKKAAEEAAKKAAGQPATPVPTGPKPEASDADKAKETLDRARQAAAGGNATLAYSLAKQSYTLTKTQEALELMGVSACRLKNADNARSAIGSLSGGRRDSVVSACNKAGITL